MKPCEFRVASCWVHVAHMDDLPRHRVLLRTACDNITRFDGWIFWYYVAFCKCLVVCQPRDSFHGRKSAKGKLGEGGLQSLCWSPFGPWMDLLQFPTRHLDSVCILASNQLRDIRKSYAWYKTYVSTSSCFRKTRHRHEMRKSLSTCISKARSSLKMKNNRNNWKNDSRFSQYREVEIPPRTMIRLHAALQDDRLHFGRRFAQSHAIAKIGCA